MPFLWKEISGSTVWEWGSAGKRRKANRLCVCERAVTGSTGAQGHGGRGRRWEDPSEVPSRGQEAGELTNNSCPFKLQGCSWDSLRTAS